MDRRQIEEAARQQHVAAQALDAITAQVQSHFGDGPVKPADLDAYLASLDVWVKLGMSQETFAAMPVTWRLQQGMAHQPPPVPRRPYRPAAPEAVRKEWEGLPLAEQATRYRAWCDEQARPEP